MVLSSRRAYFIVRKVEEEREIYYDWQYDVNMREWESRWIERGGTKFSLWGRTQLRAFSDQMNGKGECQWFIEKGRWIWEREMMLRSNRMGSFSRRGLRHSREAFSRGRRQVWVMKVSRCIAFGTKPASYTIPCCVRLHCISLPSDRHSCIKSHEGPVVP